MNRLDKLTNHNGNESIQNDTSENFSLRYENKQNITKTSTKTKIFFYIESVQFFSIFLLSYRTSNEVFWFSKKIWHLSTKRLFKYEWNHKNVIFIYSLKVPKIWSYCKSKWKKKHCLLTNFSLQTNDALNISLKSRIS